jgi:biopolymer transport protein ExbD
MARLNFCFLRLYRNQKYSMADTSNKEISLERKLKPRAKRQSIKIDMTPMVDLAFLLLTFFILTTTLAQQKSIDLILPSEGESDPVNNAITVILSDKNKLFYYIGELHDTTTLKETNFKEIKLWLRNIMLF